MGSSEPSPIWGRLSALYYWSSQKSNGADAMNCWQVMGSEVVRRSGGQRNEGAGSAPLGGSLGVRGAEMAVSRRVKESRRSVWPVEASAVESEVRLTNSS
jgi:hypothetical protein